MEAAAPARSPPTPSAGRFLLHLWRLSRPEAWMVTILPAYVGHLLATRQLVPGFERWAAFWSLAATEGRTGRDFLDTLLGTAADAAGLLLALLVMGPLVWTATLLINDVHDLAGDRINPRKARSPLVQGLVSSRFAHASAYVAAALCLAVAVLVNAVFLALTFGCLLLAWAYSVPPVRLKTRPGADVLVNAVGIGLLAGLAGWAVARPLAEFPYPFVLQGLLVATAIYVPTTLVDHEADRAAGYRTLATHLGPRAAYRIGWGAWVLANAGALLLAWQDWIIPRRMLPLLILFVPLLVWQYHLFIGRARTPEDRVRGILLIALTFLAVNLVFALMYTGLWTA